MEPTLRLVNSKFADGLSLRKILDFATHLVISLDRVAVWQFFLALKRPLPALIVSGVRGNTNLRSDYRATDIRSVVGFFLKTPMLTLLAIHPVI